MAASAASLDSSEKSLKMKSQGLPKPHLAHFCGQFGAQEASRNDFGRFWEDSGLNCLQKTRFSRFALGACRRSAESSQNHPRSAPRDPESDPGGVKSGPGEPQERPGRGPGAARRHPKIGLNAPGATPERSWKRFWSLPGLIWEFFGSPRDFIFKLFRSCPRTLRLQPLCPTNAGSAGPALAFTI